MMVGIWRMIALALMIFHVHAQNSTCPVPPKEECCTKMVSNPSIRSVLIDLKSEMMITSVKIWKENFVHGYSTPLMNSAYQRDGLVVAVGSDSSMTGCFLQSRDDDSSGSSDENSGYHSGSNSGFDSGSSMSNTGYNSGYSAGNTGYSGSSPGNMGYNSGYSAGNTGFPGTSPTNTGYNSGYSAGNTGYSGSLPGNMGYNSGYSAGNTGFPGTSPTNMGYNSGYSAGNTGFPGTSPTNTGYNSGYSAGNTGYSGSESSSDSASDSSSGSLTGAPKYFKTWDMVCGTSGQSVRISFPNLAPMSSGMGSVDDGSRVAVQVCSVKMEDVKVYQQSVSSLPSLQVEAVPGV